MEPSLTLDELAVLTAVSLDRLQEWQSLGLLASSGVSPELLIGRVHLIDHAVEQGIDAQEIARISAEQGDLLDAFAEQMQRPGRGPQTLDLASAASAVGIAPDLLARIWTASGLRDQRRVFEEDLRALQAVRAALDLGIPEEVMLQLIRVLATSQTKVAEAASRLFHFYVHEGFRSQGMHGIELVDASRAIADPASELLEPAILYFHRKAWERALMQDMILHLREEVSPPSSVPGEVDRAVLFVDLSSFTPLSEAMGDAAAADVLERFGEMVRDASVAHDGEVVKQIGDEFMLVFHSPEAAVTCGLRIEEHTAATPRFPAVRIGAHAGSVLYREGDYVGMTVNVAARVAAAADRHQLLVTRALRDAAPLPNVHFEPFGRRRLKGIADEIELFHVRRAGAHSALAMDPVCGMELDEETTSVRLHWHGEQLAFCSPECLRRFLDDPDRYVSSPP